MYFGHNFHIFSIDDKFVIFFTFNSKASERVVDNLGALRASHSLKNYATLKSIAEEVFANEGVVQNHPLD